MPKSSPPPRPMWDQPWQDPLTRMAYVTERIRELGTDANGRTLWRVKTSEGVVTEAIYNAAGNCQEILPPQPGISNDD